MIKYDFGRFLCRAPLIWSIYFRFRGIKGGGYFFPAPFADGRDAVFGAEAVVFCDDGFAADPCMDFGVVLEGAFAVFGAEVTFVAGADFVTAFCACWLSGAFVFVTVCFAGAD
jgi:hypothetical protein